MRISRPLNLERAIRIASGTSDVDTAANNGGILAIDTVGLVLKRNNLAADPTLHIEWMPGDQSVLQWQLIGTPDRGNNIFITLTAQMTGTTDQPVLVVDFREGLGSANLGCSTLPLSNTISAYTVCIPSTSLTLGGGLPWNISIRPTVHATDGIMLYSANLYTT